MLYLDEQQQEKLYNQLEAARRKYKPEKIDLLFIAEAPPNAIDRFFYYENVTEADYLYLGIVRALDEKSNVETKTLRAIKKDVLLKLKECGIFLMDLCSMPLAFAIPPIAELHKNEFIKKLEQTDGIDKEYTNIILIKANVYDCLYGELKKKGYKVVNKRIPFPASGQQKNFQVAMREALAEINFI